MSYRIDLHPEAVFELQEAYNWYEESAKGAGVRFISSVNKRLEE